MADIAYLKSKADHPFVLIGDFNARVGDLHDCIEVIDDGIIDLGWLGENHSLCEIFKENNISGIRQNQDKCINGNGKRLIKLCNITGLKIMNGRLDAERFF